MNSVTIYTKDYCGWSARAKDLLRAKGVAFTEIDVTHDAEREAEMIERSGRRTVPQIFIGDTHIGGHDDLVALDSEGGLDRLLTRPNKSGEENLAAQLYRLIAVGTGPAGYRLPYPASNASASAKSSGRLALKKGSTGAVSNSTTASR